MRDSPRTGHPTRPEGAGVGADDSPPIDSAAPTIRWPNDTIDASNLHGNPISHYRITDRIHHGTEAQIFAAQSIDGTDRVVLKIYHSGIAPSSGVLERISQSSPDHVVALRGYGRIGQDGHVYEVQDFMPNLSLLHLQTSHRLDEYNCRLVLQQISAALNHLHTPDKEGRVLVHGDIKPGNILIRTNAPTLDLVLCDFGISSVLTPEAPPAARSKSCTPQYAAPETFRGLVSPTADFWALGILLLEALTGRHPLDGIPTDRIESLVLGGWRPDLSTVESDEWKQVITGLTDPEPGTRWGHAEVAHWLEVDPVTDSNTVQLEPVETFEFLRADSIEKFAAALVLHWERVAPLLDDKLFVRYLTATLGRLAPNIAAGSVLDASGDSKDIRLLRLIYRLCPRLPHFWKGKPIRRPALELAAICREAAGGDSRQQALVQELFSQDVLRELSRLAPSQGSLAGVTAWADSRNEYSRLRDSLVHQGAPEALFPELSRVTAMLYLLTCEGGNGLNLSDDEIPPALQASFSWLSELTGPTHSISVAQRLIKSIVLPWCIEQHAENFIVSHGTVSTQMESALTYESGWNPPTIAFAGEYLDLEMAICGQQHPLAKGVRLLWDVRGAAIVHINNLGPVRSQDTRPSERTAAGLNYRMTFRCPCPDHATGWFTLWETARFSLTAIGPGGISVRSLPPIVVHAPTLAPSQTLDPFILALDPEGPTLLDSIPDLRPLPRLDVGMPGLRPIPALRPQPTWATAAIDASHLMPTDLMDSGMGKDDLRPQECFIDS